MDECVDGWVARKTNWHVVIMCLGGWMDGLVDECIDI